MELWIRSQDRETLVKVNNLSLVHDADTWEIINSYADHQYWELGTYTTKERALEVLDGIQRILHPTLLMSSEIKTNDNSWVENGIIYQKYKDNFDIQELSTYVYEMPKE